MSVQDHETTVLMKYFMLALQTTSGPWREFGFDRTDIKLLHSGLQLSPQPAPVLQVYYVVV